MDLKTKIGNFNKRWNIVENETFEEKFDKFKNRVMNCFDNIDSLISNPGISHFCNVLGLKEEWHE